MSQVVGFVSSLAGGAGGNAAGSADGIGTAASFGGTGVAIDANGTFVLLVCYGNRPEVM